MVEGSVWGALGAATEREQFPPDTEQRMAEFTELVGTAISSIQARSDLAASRARIGAAADEERRRVVRDLHDGAQQRLVQTIMTLRGAREALEPNEELASELVGDAIEQAEFANSELRELAQGLLPAVLRHGGLRAGVDALASRMPVPVDVEVSVDRLAGPVEATAYFVVAEALTNVAKHARATSASVLARVETAISGSRCVTTAWEAPSPPAPVSSAWRTGSPSSTASSGSTAQPTAARSSPPTSPSRLGPRQVPDSGSVAITSVPPPGGLSISSRPPSAVTRSPIPTRPCPPGSAPPIAVVVDSQLQLSVVRPDANLHLSRPARASPRS